MPSITASLQDLARLARLEALPDDRERLWALAKAEAKAEDAQSGEVKIELTDTNRPDLWCAEGIARQWRGAGADLAADYPFFLETPDPARRIEVAPGLASLRPYIAGFEADGLDVTEEGLKGLIEVQEKLCESYGRRRRTLAIGVYDASAIRWPVRYEAVEPSSVRFVPLGHFRELDLDEILSAHPKGVEYGGILEGAERYPLLRDADGRVLSFPPIINSRDLGEVRVGDSRLFVEVTGTGLDAVLLAINILACNLADRGGRVRPCLVAYPYDTPRGREVSTPHDHAPTVEVEAGYVGRLLGVDAGAAGIAETLRSYGVRAEEISPGRLAVTPPPFRGDVMHPCDVVEDYAIAAGYGSFEPSMPRDFTVGRVTQAAELEDAVRDLLSGFGFEEVFSNILSPPENLREKLRLPPGGLVEIENAMSRTFSVARDRVFPSLLSVESVSLKALFPHRTFEVGEVCVIEGEGPGAQPATRTRAAALLADRRAGFSDVHSYLQLLLHCLGAGEMALEPCDRPFFLPGRGASVRVGGAERGFLGELHPEVLESWGMKTPAALFELDLTGGV